MKIGKTKTRIAILGGGPSGLFMYKRFIESGQSDFEIDIFERKRQFGAGMPYSVEGANDEHITNVSANEIPELVTSVETWLQTLPEETLEHFHINRSHFNDYKVLPRLLFGQYLSAQFDLLCEKAEKAGIVTRLHPESNVTDIADQHKLKQVWVKLSELEILIFDHVIICTGHHWPKRNEGKIPRYYDSPYPPAKLALRCNHAVALKGSSLTAIDAIRTLSRYNGTFSADLEGRLSFQVSENSKDFRLVMHSRGGLLPAVRFHLRDSHLSNNSLLTPEELAQHMAA
ncbi:MAG TPA: FAD/NAD(P)-binding protein, partial [Flavobacterium sp.]|nr:FAD/NAD(P)-binding protein [Flavobacterium sp.]